MTNRERIIKTNPADLLTDMQRRMCGRGVCVMEALREGYRCDHWPPYTCEKCITDWLGEEEKTHGNNIWRPALDDKELEQHVAGGARPSLRQGT